MKKLIISTLAVTALLTGTVSATPTSWNVSSWKPAYDFSQLPTQTTYTPLERAAKQWKLCVIFPHLKDPYWVATNAGVVSHADSLGVSVDLFESGGYPNLDRQIQQVKDCAAGDYDAILLGTVSFDKMTPTVQEAAKSIPVFATVNQIRPEGISGMVAVNWIDMGRAAGEYFAKKYPAGSAPAKVAWIPGPKSAGWVKFTDQGFREAVTGTAVEIVTTKYGDTGKDIQRQLIEDALDEYPDVEYIAGNAVAIEAAMSVVRQRKLKGKVKLVADYFTPAMFRGVKRGLISSAPTDSAALQGVLSVDQAVRFLENKVIADHVGPVIFNVDKSNVKSFPIEESLAPTSFKPTFTVN
ncbi:MAG: TMAO reductase system periplasmic protein TorT [Granulosicoccus sp.]|nr:TMAO reductase system periplasmic protein TorT [Granulosicoccus sp.]